MKKIFLGIPKILFAIICYLCALILALLSGYFSIVFYAESQKGFNMWALGGLAGMLEFIKIILAAAYPFLKYRDLQLEKKVLFYLKICFFLSVMASLNFFLTGGEIEKSPASNITALLYTYIPFLNIIPLKFSQFMTTMSLSILVELFIIFLPMLAPIMFLEKDYTRKNKLVASTNFEKIKEIISVIPERFIDRLHKKIVGVDKKSNTIKDDIKVLEVKDKPKLKLLKVSPESYSDDKNCENQVIELEKKDEEPPLIDNTEIQIRDITNDKEAYAEEEHFASSSEIEKQKLLSAIYRYRVDNTCPSVKKLSIYTGLNNDSINNIKKEFENSGILKTEGRKTILLCDYNDALEKIWA